MFISDDWGRAVCHGGLREALSGRADGFEFMVRPRFRAVIATAMIPFITKSSTWTDCSIRLIGRAGYPVLAVSNGAIGNYT